MSITFNAFEILEMAEQIERNGARFYRKTAESVSQPKIKKMLLDLADMEVEHERTFAGMRKELSSQEKELAIFDPENEIALYLQAMANGHVFDMKKDASEQLSGKETVVDIFDMAIRAEKDSIIFYLGLKDFVPMQAGKEKIEKIIKEEMNHITILNRNWQLWSS